jgi:hypothetical protein
LSRSLTDQASASRQCDSHSHFKFDDLAQLALAKHFVDRPVLRGDFGTAVQ